MTHPAFPAYPTAPARPRRAASDRRATSDRRVTSDRGALRRWLSRHLVAMDPTPAPGALDVLDARRRGLDPDGRHPVDGPG